MSFQGFELYWTLMKGAVLLAAALTVMMLMLRPTMPALPFELWFELAFLGGMFVVQGLTERS